MRDLIIRFTEAAAGLTARWPSVFRGSRQITNRFMAKQTSIVERAEEEAISMLVPDLTVKAGVCRGLRYPDRKSTGSVLVPKLLGIYESELYPVLERWIAGGPDMVVDVGSAEGFYAVGLALRLPAAEIFAYDPDPTAGALFQSLASHNGVSGRIVHRGFCNAAELQTLVKGRRALVISDCEGYEDTLFAEADPQALRDADILIEAHDFLIPGITQRMVKRLEGTHNVSVITSGTGRSRAEFPAGLSAMHRFVAEAEWRPAGQQWVIAEARR